MRWATLGIFAALATSAAVAQEPSNERTDRPQIAVTATGTADLSPDYAIVRISVVTREPQASRAGEQNARVTTAVRAALRQVLRVPEDSLPSVWYSVDTDVDRERRPAGYVARSTVEARVHDLTQVGRVVDAALGAGATNVSGIQFESTRRDVARLEALSRAVETARREAEAMARAAGGRLGPLIEASSSAPAFPLRAARTVMAMAAETPITPPDLTVEATISARWVFIPQ